MARLDHPAVYIALYFVFNLSLTLYNKMMMQLFEFPFPWTLTGVHVFFGAIGSMACASAGVFQPVTLTASENSLMLMFSVLYTINIAVSNVSLHMVTVPFHQVVRSTVPFFTVLISVFFLKKQFPRAVYVALVPIIVGVALATIGEYGYTAAGMILTILGTLLAAAKTVITNRVLTGRIKLHPLDLLMRMAPLAFVQVALYAAITGELSRLRIYLATQMTPVVVAALMINGMLAFGLNWISFAANQRTSPLTISVAANIKQVLSIVLAIAIFHLHINAINAMGIVVTLAGGAWYSRVEYVERQARSRYLPVAHPDTTSGVTAGPMKMLHLRPTAVSSSASPTRVH
ncbi:hypothetical protein CXG81DRAFT_28092 [Caulochytrium protostelioides]|uniref:Sugar phosphate transporter domain-containing protein n=1 Tax=Caulochytrium protostelioides TaxID=1555241 RepID=A0A4V1IU30_9FUNG|nr:hypothetical protein CXG81DRAFT_28092 [Caulochytrium protostelioides]|eukprot:RKO99127.1 hypothetical protein CXG81DRAFT_28092 [Caulochytrium protostelioides]